ncbi:hypothetical protein GW17_00058907 [Ensete ventricosum]|nr:hypothetical protein GW17_00058907 [Ensete ventricosum]
MSMVATPAQRHRCMSTVVGPSLGLPPLRRAPPPRVVPLPIGSEARGSQPWPCPCRGDQLQSMPPARATAYKGGWAACRGYRLQGQLGRPWLGPPEAWHL